jgi:hypothetical protein
MPGGRPTKLTDEVTLKICVHILDGNFLCVAAKSCGVGQRTLRRWLSTGKEFPGGIYGRFRHEVLKAESAAEMIQVKRMQDASIIDWKAALAWLERKFPQRWGRYRGELRDLEKKVGYLEKKLAAEYPPSESAS